MKQQAEDRRRFFRITDAIGVNYTLMDTECDGDSEEQASAKGNSVDIGKLLSSQNDALQKVLAKLKIESPLAAAALNEMNKKLETVIALMEFDGKPAYSIQEASISACGIAFPSEQALEVDTKINLNLYLETSAQQIQVVGKVVGCQGLVEQDVYYLRVEFVAMEDADREKLIQHIVQRQGMLLRTLREQLEE